MSRNQSLLLLLSLCVTFIPKRGMYAQTVANQKALHTYLFSTYDAGEIPYCGQPINLTLDLALRNMIDLNEPLQILKLKLWIRMNWNDCRLRWNSSDYGNITNYVVPYKAIWVPDITVFDSVSSDFNGVKDYRPKIYSDGTVHYNFQSLLEVSCTLDVKHFPYDQQSCKLVFGSWVFSGLDMDIQYKNKNADFSSAERNIEWSYISMKATRNVGYYGCCPDPYPDITYQLIIKRKPLFFITSLFLPVFLISSMSIWGFVLPVESGEKVSFQITVMFSLLFFQLIVADMLPPSAETTPVIVTFFTLLLFLIGYAIMEAVIVSTIHYLIRLPMPRILYKIFILKLSVITLVHTEIHQESPQTCKNELKDKETTNINCAEISTKEKHWVTSNAKDWKALARIIDILSLYVFILIYVIGTASILSQL